MDEDIRKIINKNKSQNPWRNMILTVVISSVLVIAISYFMNGIYINGIPKVQDIEKVEIISEGTRGYSKTFTDNESIQLAYNLRNYLNYNIGKGEESSASAITINYEKKNGEIISVSANDKTLWYKGKSHPLKEEGAFVKIAAGVFDSK